jgi:hypothetical protein
MEDNKKYNGWVNRETWCFHLWLTSDEPLYNLTRMLLKAFKEEAEIEQLDLEFGLLGHVVIIGLQNAIANMNTSNQKEFKPFVDGWMKLKDDTGDISKVDKPELSRALMELIE